MLQVHLHDFHKLLKSNLNYTWSWGPHILFCQWIIQGVHLLSTAIDTGKPNEIRILLTWTAINVAKNGSKIPCNLNVSISAISPVSPSGMSCNHLTHSCVLNNEKIHNLHKGKVLPRTGHESPEGYSYTLSLTSALDVVGSQRQAPAALPPVKTPHPLNKRLVGPQGRSGQVQKISPPPAFGSRTIQPVAIRHNLYS
jgi:hypothetical protein